MKLFGRNKLQTLYGLDEETDKWIRGWASEVACANWKHPLDVLRQFPQAKSVAENIFRFRVGDQPKFIDVSMTFPRAVAIVIDLKHTKS
jgi:mRNA-degrading endonuclease HigB of HigAB toxin-antitoxin module